MCRDARTVEVKLLCIVGLCVERWCGEGKTRKKLKYGNIFIMRSYGISSPVMLFFQCPVFCWVWNQFVHWFALYAIVPSIFLPDTFKTSSKNNQQCIWTRIAFDGELQRRVKQINERTDFTPNKTKEVSLQNYWTTNVSDQIFYKKVLFFFFFGILCACYRTSRSFFSSAPICRNDKSHFIRTKIRGIQIQR